MTAGNINPLQHSGALALKELRILPTECSYVFHIFATINRGFFLNSVKRMVFVMAAWNAPCEVGAQF